MKRKIIFIFLFIFLNNVVFADIKTDIYSKLKCFCCKKDVSVCDCPHSKEIKAYIDALLEVGLNEEEILIKIAKRYSLDNIKDEKTRKIVEKKLIELAPKKRPQIFIHPLSYNLGKISKKKKKIELRIPIQNKGEEALKITKLKTSCECTTVRLKTKDYESPPFSMGMEGGTTWQATLNPGEKGELIIVTDLNHSHVKTGHLLRVVEVESNDPIHPLIRIQFEADIVE